jgi:hypothetical protein
MTLWSGACSAEDHRDWLGPAALQLAVVIWVISQR